MYLLNLQTNISISIVTNEVNNKQPGMTVAVRIITSREVFSMGSSKFNIISLCVHKRTHLLILKLANLKSGS